MHGQHHGSGRRSYRIAGGGGRTLPSPASFGHVEDLIPGYALGALEPAELAAVDAHVRYCPSCERELSEARSSVGMLPFIVPMQTPPIAAKAALFARVSHVQKAAVAAALPTSQLDVYRTPTLPEATGRDLVAAGSSRSGSDSSAKPRDSRFGWMATALSLPLLVALVVTGFWGLQMREQLSSQSTEIAELESQFANFASGTTSYPLSPGFDAPQAEGQIVMGADQRTGRLQIDVNSANGPREFEMWVNQDGELTPAGEVQVNENGQGEAWIELEQPLGEYESVHVRAKPVDAVTTSESLDTLVRDSEGPLGATGSGLDFGP